MWLWRLLADFGQKQSEATEIFCDSKAAIVMSKNPVFYGRTKYIDIRIHFICDLVVEVEFYCNTIEKVANVFTKSLPQDEHIYLRN